MLKETTLEAASRNVTTAREELRKAEQLEKQVKEDYSKRSKEQSLAIALHENFCRWDHNDGCSWFYEIKNGVRNWSAFTHERYLEKAVKITENFPKLDTHELVQATLIAKN